MNNMYVCNFNQAGNYFTLNLTFPGHHNLKTGSDPKYRLSKKAKKISRQGIPCYLVEDPTVA
jgi:hypothetical protein